MLQPALDVLLAEGARFKVINRLERLNALNSGRCGVSQIGKFITVYPSDDSQAVRLALKLHESTSGLSGPRVPTDRPLRPRSLVHYRYGAMHRRPGPESEVAIETGAYDLLDSAGRLSSDWRLPFYLPPPAGIVDPFEANSAYVACAKGSPLLNGRYLVSNALAQSPRGGVFRAVDLGTEPVRLCLLKEIWRDVGFDDHGRDAQEWIMNERRILLRHRDDPLLPRLYDSFEVNGDQYNVIEYIEGLSLDRALSTGHSLMDGIDPSRLIHVGLGTAAALAHLHDIGVFFRDFKPGNVVETPAGHYRLIDFAIAYDSEAEHGPALRGGTPPFYAPEQFEDEIPSAAADVFAWGAVLHYLACGDASLAEMPQDEAGLRPFRRRPVVEWRPRFPACIAAVIDRAVAWDHSERYASMRAAYDALAEAALHIEVLSSGSTEAEDREPRVAGQNSTPVQLLPDDALHLAREVGNALCAAAEKSDGGLCWAARNEMGVQLEYSPDLYSGTAGVALFLGELTHATGEQLYAETARGAVRWLAGPMWGRGRAQHGLHGGEPGVAYAFLRLAELLDEPGYVTAAELRLRRLRGAPSTTIDLLHGTAGTILALLSVYVATGDSTFLQDARKAGDDLVHRAVPARDGGGTGFYWDVPSVAPTGLCTPFLGLLHGSAGIGLALARLAAVTREERYLLVAQGAAELLLAHAHGSRPCGPQDDAPEEPALRWPRQLTEQSLDLQAHCHGAGGIGEFFLQLNRLARDPRYLAAAVGAALTVSADLDSEARSCFCHGLSGAGHFLLDCYQVLGARRWLERAAECGSRLQSFRDPQKPGVYRMNRGAMVSPDLMLGYCGVGSLLLRLASAEAARELILGYSAPLAENGNRTDGAVLRHDSRGNEQ